MHHHHHNGSHQAARGLAQGLGWFSIALGIAEIAAPHTIARALGMRGSERLIQGCGLREIATGAGILASRDPTPWLWGRVAGDALDLATLSTAMHHGNRQRRNVALAMGAVGAATLLDIFCAQKMGEAAEDLYLPSVDYSDRDGYPIGLHAARGAAGDFQDRAFSTPDALKPWTHGQQPQNGWSESGGGRKVANSNAPSGATARSKAGRSASLQQAAGSQSERDEAFRTGPTFTGKGNEGP